MALTPLSSAKAPDLVNYNRDDAIAEITTRMQTLEGWNNIWVSNQYQDASQFVIQMFAYMFEKNAINLNKNIRENFLTEANTQQTVNGNLSRMGISPVGNSTSMVTLLCSLMNNPNPCTQDLVLNQFQQVTGVASDNSIIPFEIIDKNDDGTYNYTENKIIPVPTPLTLTTFSVNAYAGTTKMISIPINANTFENFMITLPFSSIIDGSVQAYYQTPSGIMIPLNKVSRFSAKAADPTIVQQAVFTNGKVPTYIVRNDNNNPMVYFGSSMFGGSFDASFTGNIVVYCRVGGGKLSNVGVTAIQSTFQLQVSNTLTYNIYATNPLAALGGSDAEDYLTAKIYAPLRYGADDKAILTEADAQKTLQPIVNKLFVDSPQYSELGSTIPLLHIHNYVVPLRGTGIDDVGLFTYPQVLAGDTITTYAERLYSEVNSYLAVKGTNDSNVTNEGVTLFSSDAQLQYMLGIATTLNDNSSTYKVPSAIPVLTGTLALYAYDYLDQQIDMIEWTGNYIKTPNGLKSDIGSSSAKIVSSSINVLTTRAIDVLNISFDGMPMITLNFSAAGASTLGTNIQSIVNYFNVQMQSIFSQPQYVEYSQFKNSTFFDYVNNGGNKYQMIITSPRVGSLSKITIYPGVISADDIYLQLGLTVGTVFPSKETGKVFVDGTYNNSNGTVIANINQALILNQGYTVQYSTLNPIQNSGGADGPIVTITLTDELPNTLLRVVPGSDLTVYAVDANGSVLDQIVFNSISDSNPTSGSTGGTGSVFDTAKIITQNATFEYDKSLILLPLAEGVIVQQYSQTYALIGRMEVHTVTFQNGQYVIAQNDINVIFQNEGQAINPYNILDKNSWTQDVFNAAAKTTQLILPGLSANTTYEVTTYDINNNVVAQLLFQMPIDLTASTQQINFTLTQAAVNKCFNINSNMNYYDPSIDSFIFNFLAPTENTSPLTTIYKAGFVPFSKLLLTYERQTYDYIIATYTPNPYMPTMEAAEIVSYLKQGGKRIIGVEQVIKNVRYAPIGCTINVYITRGYSLMTVENQVRSVLNAAFAFNNSSATSQIGQQITAEVISSTISTALPQLGIVRIDIADPYLYEGMDESIAAKSYFFIAPQEFVDSAITIENANPQLGGISDLFNIKINVAYNA